MITPDQYTLKAFTKTSDAPYDRHKYKIWCVDGSVKIVDDWDTVLTAHWNFPQHISHVEVIDKSPTKGKGFS